MRPAWILALGVTAWASWAAWRGPPPQPTRDYPGPIERPPTEQTLRRLNDAAEALSHEVGLMRQKLGRPILATELEGHALDGTPFLTNPLPDNPLVEGVGTVTEHCGSGPAMGSDWIYCPDTATFTPHVPN